MRVAPVFPSVVGMVVLPAADAYLGLRRILRALEYLLPLKVEYSTRAAE